MPLSIQDHHVEKQPQHQPPPHAPPHAQHQPHPQTQPRPAPAPPPAPVSWLSLPRKDQMLILFLCRLVDFLQVASLQAYVFYQLRHMSPASSSPTVAKRAGLLQGCFTGAQVATALLWGKAADAPWCGRKAVVALGLAGTAVSCVGYGFATTLPWAAFWRVAAGAVNGTVGVVRTMLSEMIREKKYQSRAFLILPMSFNVAGILGPFFGGILASPATTLPRIFAPGRILGFAWIQKYPFALPSLVNAAALSLVTIIVVLFLEETSPCRRNHHDPYLALGQRIKNALFYNTLRSTSGYALLHTKDTPAATPDPESSPRTAPTAITRSVPRRRLPFSRIWTRNVLLTLLTLSFYDFHLGAFSNIWSLFLSTPRYTETSSSTTTTTTTTLHPRSLPLLFTGGLGMPASTVGIATSLLGVLGMALQLTLYPSIHARLGTLRSFRCFLPLFPLAYLAVPYLAILPASSSSSSVSVWLGIVFVLAMAVTARTFTLPASLILLNNCSPHPSVLGTVHGLGQSVSATARTVGPVVAGYWYAYGLDIGMVAWGWWSVAAVAVVGCLGALVMYEGSGHEVCLPGEEEARRDGGV